METTGIYRDYRVYIGVIYWVGTPLMENQMEKKMENEMETWIMMGNIGVI